VHFSYESALRSFSLLHFGFVIFWQNDVGKKSEFKMLMKFTQGEDFTKLSAPSENLQTHSAWQKNHHSLSPTLKILNFSKQLC
jgi:hypothetical protein